VVWVAELKNVLSLPPLLLAFSFYLDYDERTTTARAGRFMLLFLVAMLLQVVGGNVPGCAAALRLVETRPDRAERTWWRVRRFF